MQRWQGPAEVPEDWGSSVVTIGVFDGVHRGHQRIISRARQAASDLGLPMVVVTFDPHPDEIVRPGSHPPFLCTTRRRSQLLAGLGVDAVCMIEFNLEFSRLGPDEFVRAVLADRLHVARVVVGEDFRFGHKAAGDLALLAQLGEKYDFTAEGVPLLTEDGVRISSTEIRARLAEGDVAGDPPRRLHRQYRRTSAHQHEVGGAAVRRKGCGAQPLDCGRSAQDLRQHGRAGDTRVHTGRAQGHCTGRHARSPL